MRSEDLIETDLCIQISTIEQVSRSITCGRKGPLFQLYKNKKDINNFQG